jgi:hypothetical protein
VGAAFPEALSDVLGGHLIHHCEHIKADVTAGKLRSAWLSHHEENGDGHEVVS